MHSHAFSFSFFSASFIFILFIVFLISNNHPRHSTDSRLVLLDTLAERQCIEQMAATTTKFSKRETLTMEEALLAPYKYLCQVPGKEIRTLMINAFNDWLNLDPTQLTSISNIVRKLHTSSLMIDDVEDNSDLRRGIPVTHKIYGVPMTINTANYVYFIALQDVLAMKDAKLVEIFTEELLNLHRGQGMELYWRDTMTCPTEEQYLEMVGHKTGGLFRLAVKMMQQCSELSNDYSELVNMMGAFFQIRDDYMNLQSMEYSNNKGYCEDLTEGKFSFVITHAITHGEDGAQLMSILRQKTADNNVKSYAVSLMAKARSFEYTKGFLDRLEDDIAKKIKELGGNRVLEQLMDKLSVRDSTPIVPPSRS